MNVRVMLADDHAVLREGLKVLLNAQPDLEVVAQAKDVPSSLATAREVTPDIVVMDITMPGGSGLDVIAEIRRDSPGTRVLVLTMHSDQSFLRAALEAGASGYLVKDSAGNELLSAIRAVHQGQSYISVPLADDELQGVTDSAVDGDGSATQRALDQLSPREREVLGLLAFGHTNRAIADLYDVSVKTIETHRARLSEKLQLRSRVDLIRFALRAGILTPDSKENP